jgi:hypothetical protein
VGFRRWGWISAGGGWRRRSRQVDRHRLRPGVLELEQRRLLATFTATSTAETLTDGLPTVGTLRWAISLANSPLGANTVDFDPNDFSSHQTIRVTLGQLELTGTSGLETIPGPAAGVTISGGRAVR